MKFLFTLILSITLTSCAIGQIGLAVKHTPYYDSGWKNSNILGQKKSSQEYALNYWIRMKNRRLEFLPELTYSQLSTQWIEGQSHFKRYGVGVQALLYPLDFEGDCNCPTFSKQNDFFKKAWYFGLTTIIGFYDLLLSGDLGNIELENSSLFTRIGVVTGLDIGVNDLITLTPFLQYNRSLFTKTYTSTLQNAISDKLTEFQIGLRAGFRFDYKG